VQLRLHNTLTRRKEDFQPIDPNRVRLYVCGPTVYQRIHVGNARAFVVFDVLYRLLRHLYGENHVVYVRNITDIDDKIMDQARADSEDIRALTERTAAQFHEDLAALGCLPPTHEPRATDHVGGMIALIEDLIARGHAYVAEGHVLFSVPSMPNYGRLSGRNRDEQIAGARVDVAPYKRDPADFVLWKPSAENQPGWDSPWGCGRPGWHIECSAMSEAFLAPLPFDIHAGGLDLIFPHHENEIAQSCCARGIDTMARFWLHNGFLDMRGEKMSKSVGNVIRVPEALAHVQGEALRLFLLSADYRQPANFTIEAAHEAKKTLDRFYRLFDVLNISWVEQLDEQSRQLHPPHSNVVDALSNDLNFPLAIVCLREMADHVYWQISEGEQADAQAGALRLKNTASLLGLMQSSSRTWFGRVEGLDIVEIEARIAARRAARDAGNYSEADRMRRDLFEDGIILEDTHAGTKWRRA
jgi:cysteinyl-tRNA synthetase